jgi:hypothetical protein
MYGFAADNVLKWEIVTASWQPQRRMRVSTGLCPVDTGYIRRGALGHSARFPRRDHLQCAFSFSVSQAGGVKQYWNAVSVFHQQLKQLLDQGMVAEYGFTNETLVVAGVMAPGQTSD